MKRVWADVPGDRGGPCDPLDHAVDVALVDGIAGQDQRPADAFTAADLEDAQDWDSDRHRRGIVALADQVKDTVSAHCLGVVLDPYSGGFRCSQRVDAEQVGQRA